MKTDVDIQEVGQRIREAREEAGLSQQALSELIGVSRWTIDAWEKREQRLAGHYFPTIKAALKAFAESNRRK